MLELDQFLPYRLSLLSNQVSRGIAETYADRYGLSVTAWRVLAVIGRYDGLTATEVAERTAMDKVAVSRAIKTLSDKRYVRRRQARHDGRAQALSLSQRGQTVYNAVVPAALAYERQLLDHLSAAERKQLNTLIDRLLKAST
jgi:DNA-binding MarR family transcriptional regulator